MHATGITKAWASTLTLALGIALFCSPPWWWPSSRPGTLSACAWASAPTPKPALTNCAAVPACWCRSARSAPVPSGATLIMLIYPRLSRIAWSVPTSPTVPDPGGGIGPRQPYWGTCSALLIGSVPGIWIGAQRPACPRRWCAGCRLALVTAGLKVIH